MTFLKIVYVTFSGVNSDLHLGERSLGRSTSSSQITIIPKPELIKLRDIKGIFLEIPLLNGSFFAQISSIFTSLPKVFGFPHLLTMFRRPKTRKVTCLRTGWKNPWKNDESTAFWRWWNQPSLQETWVQPGIFTTGKR